MKFNACESPLALWCTPFFELSQGPCFIVLHGWLMMLSHPDASLSWWSTVSWIHTLVNLNIHCVIMSYGLIPCIVILPVTSLICPKLIRLLYRELSWLELELSLSVFLQFMNIRSQDRLYLINVIEFHYLNYFTFWKCIYHIKFEVFGLMKVLC